MGVGYDRDLGGFEVDLRLVDYLAEQFTLKYPKVLSYLTLPWDNTTNFYIKMTSNKFKCPKHVHYILVCNLYLPGSCLTSERMPGLWLN